AQLQQALAQLLIVQRLEFIEEREKQHRRDLREENRQHDENRPGKHPPAFRRYATRPIDQLNHDCAQYQPDDPSLGLVPYPAAQPLVGELLTVLQAEAVVVEPERERLAE